MCLTSPSSQACLHVGPGRVGRAGVPLQSDGDGMWVCPDTGERYIERNDVLTEASDS